MMSPNPISGLSPRVRGNRKGIADADGRARSIPASAGEPSLKNATSENHKVYPRECGGTPEVCNEEFGYVGLSPRVRGNPTDEEEVMATYRSIPASAGEPYQACSNWRGSAVYPRECGGTVSSIRLISHLLGLSPRVRGNRSGA